MRSKSRVLAACGWLALLTAIGTLGFVSLEELSWVNALYLTIVTISTVGYGDLAPQTPLGQIFAATLIVTGVGTTLYLLSVIAQEILEGRLHDLYHRRSMERRIEHDSGHVIVCGFGRYGRIVVDELLRAGREVAVVEKDPAAEARLEELGVAYLIGSATSDEILQSAGIERAEVLVVATSNEADNVFITLSARDFNPKLRIHARGESAGAIRRLRRAGADFVNSPYQMGGIRTAASILRPSVVDFLELSAPHRSESIDLEEVLVGRGSKIESQSVREIEQQSTRLRVVGLKRSGDPIDLVPPAEATVGAGDYLVVIGDRDELAQLARHALAEEP